MKLRILVAAWLAAVLAVNSSAGTDDAGVDRIFVNAHAYTLDDSKPWAEAVAIDGDTIVYVGDNAGALALAGSATKRHDLEGGMLLPGFIDTHMHPVAGGAYAKALSLDTFGTVEGRTAAMFEDYRGEPGNSGETVFAQQQMTQMIFGAAEKQVDVHVHALGERAVHETLNGIEAARKKHPKSDTRYTICHIQVITDDDLPRFAELDVIAQSTPLWASYDTYGKPFVSEDQFNRFWRFKSLDDLGVKLTWGSDFPASGAGMLGMSPVLHMEIGHTRQEPGEPEALVQPRKFERLELDTLIRGYTIDAAYQLHMEDQIGSLSVGKKADLVVLDRNLLACANLQGVDNQSRKA